MPVCGGGARGACMCMCEGADAHVRACVCKCVCVGGRWHCRVIRVCASTQQQKYNHA